MRAHLANRARTKVLARADAADRLDIPVLRCWRSPSVPRWRAVAACAGVRPGCRAVRDSTHAAWYPPPYAPRAGGAYDSHHRTAGVAGRTRRRGGRVAARGAR